MKNANVFKFYSFKIEQFLSNLKSNGWRKIQVRFQSLFSKKYFAVFFFLNKDLDGLLTKTILLRLRAILQEKKNFQVFTFSMFPVCEDNLASYPCDSVFFFFF